MGRQLEKHSAHNLVMDERTCGGGSVVFLIDPQIGGDPLSRASAAVAVVGWPVQRAQRRGLLPLFWS